MKIFAAGRMTSRIADERVVAATDRPELVVRSPAPCMPGAQAGFDTGASVFEDEAVGRGDIQLGGAAQAALGVGLNFTDLIDGHAYLRKGQTSADDAGLGKRSPGGGDKRSVVVLDLVNGLRGSRNGRDAVELRSS